MSIHLARPPSARQACGTPTGTTPQAPGSSVTPRPSRYSAGAPFEHVEALLERVDVEIDVTVVERAQAEAHVHGARRAVDESRPLEPLLCDP